MCNCKRATRKSDVGSKSLNYLNDKQTINGSRTIAEADQPKTRLITYDANIDLTIKESTDSIKTVLNEIAKIRWLYV